MNHLHRALVVRCYNPVCGARSEPGLKFCDSCLTGMCYGKLSVYKMFDEIQREKVVWDRGPVNFEKKNLEMS
jgi:hypothetical protein